MGFPVSPTNGQQTIINGKSFRYDSANNTWKVVQTTLGTRINYTASNTAPTSALNGDLWYKINQDIIFEYISDGTASYWVDITSQTFSTQTSVAVTSTSLARSVGYSLVFGA